MPLTPQEVAGKVFGPTRMRRGYDENEVDAFLDQVEAELTRLTTENERLQNEVEQLRAGKGVSATTESAGKPSDPLVKTPPATPAAVEAPAAPPAPAAVEAAPAVVAAEPAAPPAEPIEQQVARMLVLAQQTADAAINEAQKEAESTRGSARIEAERVLSEARSRAAEEIGSLERSKSGLETQIEELQTFEREYRQRLRAYLEMQLHDLETGKSGPPSLEGPGKQPGQIGASGEGTNGSESSAAGGEARGGLSDPPGFGHVWSPGDAGSSSGDPLVTTPGDPESSGGVSPFDTGSEGHHEGG